MKTEEHMEECEEKLGEGFEEVHRFLDTFAEKFGWSHRKVLHHSYGVEMVRQFFGKKAKEAAIIHIKADCDGEIPEIEDWLDADYWLNTGNKEE